VAAVDTKGKPPAKGGKDAKKGAANTASIDETAVAEDSQYVKEMKEAIRIEKSIFRYRLVQIRNWTLKQLKEMRQQALDLYKLLEDWVFVSQRVEMDAIEEMCVIIKEHIEDETKIQDELRIKFMDFTVDKSVLNYITPPPPKFAPFEEIKDDRFTIPQLECLIEEFQMQEKLYGCSELKVETLA